MEKRKILFTEKLLTSFLCCCSPGWSLQCNNLILLQILRLHDSSVCQAKRFLTFLRKLETAKQPDWRVPHLPGTKTASLRVLEGRKLAARSQQCGLRACVTSPSPREGRLDWLLLYLNV